MQRKRLFSLWLLGLAFSAASVPAAVADTVSFSLLNPGQTATPGSVLTYVGTVSAPATNSGQEFLNGVSETTSGGPLTVDDGDFLANFPLFLNPGDSYTGDLFTIAATAGSAGTTTLGTIVLQGGSTENDFDQLGSANFSAQVASGAATTPEPSSLLLLATGLMGGMATLRRRRGAASAA